MPMLAAVTCAARHRRMHCRGSDTTVAAAALELDQGQHGPGGDIHRHRWRDQRTRTEPAPTGVPSREQHRLPRAPVLNASSRQGRRRLSAAVVLKKATAAGMVETAGAPPSSSLLCAVCLEEVWHGRRVTAAEEKPETTLPCSHSFHPGCVLPWLAAHGACPCCRATVLSPEKVI